MPITGGTVTFEQSKKLAEYENRKASVSFSVTEDEDATTQVATALDIAKDLVFVALDLTKIGKPRATPAARTAKTPPKTVTDDTPTADNDGFDTDDTKAEISKGGPREDPETKPEEAATEEEDIFSADVPEITDKELMDKIARRNSDLQKTLGDKAPPTIRGLIGKYVQAPKVARDIPQAARAEFLEQLAALN